MNSHTGGLYHKNTVVGRPEMDIPGSFSPCLNVGKLEFYELDPPSIATPVYMARHEQLPHVVPLMV
jgi:hypothetical protein